MSYINVGAYVNNQRPATKKALREALRDDPSAVFFDSTSPFGPRAGEQIELPTLGNDQLSVVGPDPYRKRSWYATIKVVNDKIVIS